MFGYSACGPRPCARGIPTFPPGSQPPLQLEEGCEWGFLNPELSMGTEDPRTLRSHGLTVPPVAVAPTTTFYGTTETSPPQHQLQQQQQYPHHINSRYHFRLVSDKQPRIHFSRPPSKRIQILQRIKVNKYLFCLYQLDSVSVACKEGYWILQMISFLWYFFFGILSTSRAIWRRQNWSKPVRRVGDWKLHLSGREEVLYSP